ncbi:MAG: GNAT family N-acetyltransferase [Bacteroidota bacterium]
MDVVIRKQTPEDDIPWGLLLEADPSRVLVEACLSASELWRLQKAAELLGIYVLYPVNAALAEVKNISITEAHQGKGWGTALLRHATERARQLGYQKLQIGTADASLAQQRLYEREGFTPVQRISDFFVTHYAEPIYDQGAQCRDMIMMEKAL